jgi:hypothetical protein
VALTDRQIIIAEEIIKVLKDNEDILLKEAQTSFCCGSSGQSKIVYKNPQAYHLGRLLRENF